MNQTNFSQMICDYEKLVYTICYQFTHNHHTAQDLMQDTFLSVYTHLDTCPDENPKAWVARIATNKAKDHLKSAYNRRVQSVSDEAMPSQGVLFLTESRPDDAVDTIEGCQIIATAIDELKEPYRQVAQMHFLQQKSPAEIAETLDRPRKTVQTQIFRARQQLRPNLAQFRPAAAMA